MVISNRYLSTVKFEIFGSDVKSDSVTGNSFSMTDKSFKDARLPSSLILMPLSSTDITASYDPSEPILTQTARVVVLKRLEDSDDPLILPVKIY